MKNPLIIKFTEIIILNIFFVFLVLFVADYFTYLKFKNDYIKNHEDVLEFCPPIEYLDKYKSGFSPNTLIFQNGKNNNLDYFRPVSGEKYKDKNSILIFGCSFAYSHLLEDNQTISEKLSQFTKRTVYNFGMSACGIQHMYKLIELGGKLFEKIKKHQAILYIFIFRLICNVYNQICFQMY